MYSERDLELLERAEEIFRANIYSSNENFPWSPYRCISPGKQSFAVADKIRETILDMCYNEKSGMYENYNSVTGKGLCCDHFSRSCVFIREFILNRA